MAYHKDSLFRPALSGRRAPRQMNSPSTSCGKLTSAFSFPPTSFKLTAISPLGCGIEPEACVNLPRCGRIETRLNPGAAESMPSTVRKSSIVRTRAPGVAIRARRLRGLGPRRQTEREHLVPLAEQVKVPVTFAHLVHSRMEVVAEVVSGLGQRRIAEHTIDERARVVALDSSGENSERVGLLRELFLQRACLRTVAATSPSKSAGQSRAA